MAHLGVSVVLFVIFLFLLFIFFKKKTNVNNKLLKDAEAKQKNTKLLNIVLLNDNMSSFELDTTALIQSADIVFADALTNNFLRTLQKVNFPISIQLVNESPNQWFTSFRKKSIFYTNNNYIDNDYGMVVELINTSVNKNSNGFILFRVLHESLPYQPNLFVRISSIPYIKLLSTQTKVYGGVNTINDSCKEVYIMLFTTNGDMVMATYTAIVEDFDYINDIFKNINSFMAKASEQFPGSLVLLHVSFYCIEGSKRYSTTTEMYRNFVNETKYAGKHYTNKDDNPIQKSINDKDFLLYPFTLINNDTGLYESIEEKKEVNYNFVNISENITEHAMNDDNENSVFDNSSIRVRSWSVSSYNSNI